MATKLDEAYDASDLLATSEESAELRWDGRRIETCMQELETDRSSAFRCAYVEGLKDETLADVYGVPLNTTRTWLQRSLL
ncbi:sigma factor-like helix-turn-helix DNA-binding protein [Sinorhizobium sp. BG8]|uniref:sigma factor-like helix-turn-helix DNA-binding protein n=1 Tax=Sinorhizobium sp. BG8 TaxID=2613773 RepID=UPI00193CA437|nr:sigma factor-like helix-turn-helix DNA-binding protein [Sinorhizobium sp. BG8]QRM54055.1 hypothetical protein F3Y30_05435 [Sinorhizobium sp. BG8]